MNKAMASLSETVGEDVPSFDEIRDKIESRYAKAKGMSELTESSVESRMLEVEQAAMNTEAQARLSEIRSQLGLSAPEPEPAEAITETSTAQTSPPTAATETSPPATPEPKPAEG
jgi:phage shock protein A